MATKQETEIALKILKTIAEAIRKAHKIPSGHLYAMLIPHLTLDQYNMVINALKKMKLVEEKYHELTWIGN